MARPKTLWTAEALLARTVDDAGCRVWQGRTHTQNGVPLVDHDAKPWTVRRLLLTLLGRRIEPTDLVRCTCETPGCIEPEHLRVVPRQRHMAEVAAMGARNELLRRQRIAATVRQRYAVLTTEQAQMVRESRESSAELARRLGVNKSMVSRIRRGEAWVTHSSPWAGMGAR